MTTENIITALLIAFPSMFALWSKLEASKAVKISTRNNEEIKALNDALFTITGHIDGKMDALLKTSIALSKLEGINEERKRQEDR